ncbi:hypothetical protein OE88DRAFT_1665997 [Heliocybe sulcata]|uniref:F-box domain-containing protein n=1 Tax=Heliocybe sulcata TaxID=5364 RepID=A0A5C3N0N3_9AGAM|nr:hypothetical protein OE88DRAFT_1665997 [Heliocybe sulcata]
MLYENVALRVEQLVPFLATIKNHSTPVELSSKVKHLAVECIIERKAVVIPEAAEGIISCCSQLKSLAYISSKVFDFRTGSRPIETVYSHTSMSSLSGLSLGRKISSGPPLLRLLQQMPQLQSLSFHLVSHGETSAISSTDTVELPNLASLSVTLCSSSLMHFVHQLSTPALTSLRVSYGEHWDSGYDAAGKIIASKGCHLKYLEVDTENDLFGDERILDQEAIEHCPVLEHLVLCKYLNFYATHPTLRFIDIWRRIPAAEHWGAVAKCATHGHSSGILRTVFPQLERVRVLDRSIPGLPTILPPTRLDEANLRLVVADTVVWDTPTLVFREWLLIRGMTDFLGKPSFHSATSFVQNAHLHLGNKLFWNDSINPWQTTYDVNEMVNDELPCDQQGLWSPACQTH